MKDPIGFISLKKNKAFHSWLCGAPAYSQHPLAGQSSGQPPCEFPWCFQQSPSSQPPRVQLSHHILHMASDSSLIHSLPLWLCLVASYLPVMEQ